MNNIEKFKEKFLGYKYLILDAENKIEYGFHFSEIGKSYHLRTLINGKWMTTAFCYNHIINEKERLINYLTWSRDKNLKIKKTIFDNE